jgi:hypothetical protein
MKVFLIAFLAAAAAFAESWQGVERIVAVGDVHGSYSQFVTVLRQAGVLQPSKDKWAGGKTHLVQLGDVPDRAPDTRRILDLLMDLEKQAKKAGGMVHALIGNHEAMNMYGDLRYTIPEEFDSFRRSNSEEIRAEFWKMHEAELRDSGQSAKLTVQYQREWEKQYPLGWFEHRYEFGPGGKYGKWIRNHNAVIRINDTLFLHGGISPKYSNRSVTEINDQIRRELADFKLLEGGGMAIDPEGPLWYRGLAIAPEDGLRTHVEALLASYGVKRIVVGHTPTSGAVIPRFDGRVLLADVGLSIPYGGRMACVVIEGEKVVAIHRGVPLPIPSASSDVLAYLKKAAETDPAPSPLTAAIRALEGSTLTQLAVPDDQPSARRPAAKQVLQAP